jgi:hypothetical protein
MIPLDDWPHPADIVYNSPPLSNVSEDHTIPTVAGSAPSQFRATHEAQTPPRQRPCKAQIWISSLSGPTLQTCTKL